VCFFSGVFTTSVRALWRERSPRRELLALFVFELREPFEDERVRLVGQLGDQRQVITTEAHRHSEHGPAVRGQSTLGVAGERSNLSEL